MNVKLALFWCLFMAFQFLSMMPLPSSGRHLLADNSPGPDPETSLASVRTLHLEREFCYTCSKAMYVFLVGPTYVGSAIAWLGMAVIGIVVAIVIVLVILNVIALIAKQCLGCCSPSSCTRYLESFAASIKRCFRGCV